MTEQWIVDDAGTLINMKTRETYDYVSDLVDELNEQEETIQDLKTRNNRQYELLKKITDLMCARDWKTLDQMVEEWEESDRLLKSEFKCCNDGDME